LATTGWGISWTGREDRAVGGEDDAERVAVPDLPERVRQLHHHVEGERVALLGAVQGDGGDGVVALDEQVLVRHAAIVAPLPGRPHPEVGRTARTFVSDLR